MLAGEDRNDRKCLRLLLEASCPDMSGRIVEISDPVRLRQASETNLADRVAKLARLARARAKRENADLACVFVHEDLDATDGDDYVQKRARVQKALKAELGNAHYVLAVWELEAWLLLFPDALAAFASSWRVPAKYLNRDTGKLTDPKRIMMREMSKTARRYRESDAPDVFAKIIELGGHRDPVGTNRSWTRFRADIDECCSDHVTRTPASRS